MQLNASQIFVRGLMGVLVLSTLIVAGIYWHIYGYEKLFGDFQVFYAASHHILANETADIYTIVKVKRLYAEHGIKDFAFFLNPPTGLFIVYPLALLSTLPALIVWSGGQFMLLWLLIRGEYLQRLFGPGSERSVNTSVLLTIALLAFSLQNLLFGQLAVFCTVLFLSVLALRKTHPVLAGIVLGIFSFKPQLGLLLPLLLLAEWNIKTLITAIVVAACMAALSWLFWGNGLWQDYAEMMKIRSRFMAEDPDLLFVISTSFYAALRNLGVPATAALLSQGILALVTIAAIWPVLRKGEESHKILMLTLAIYLVTPYSLVYDMPLLAFPTVYLLRRAEMNKAALWELIALLLLILMPLVTILLQIAHIPYSIIAIGSALIVARWRTYQKQSE